MEDISRMVANSKQILFLNRKGILEEKTEIFRNNCTGAVGGWAHRAW